MSNRISWFAVALKSPDETLAVLRHADSGVPVRPGECAVAGGSLPGGPYVIVLDEFWHPMLHPSAMQALSSDCVVVGYSESENTNTSLVFLYREGRQVWQVSHVQDEGDDNLHVAGAAPAAVASLLAKAKAARATSGHDAVFGVPAALAANVCGFRHDATSDMAFTRLDPVPDPDLLPGPQISAAFVTCMNRVLQSEGFAPPSRPIGPEALARINDIGEIQCFARCSHGDGGGAYCDIVIHVRNARVQALASVTPDVTVDWTCKLFLSRIGGPATRIRSADDLAKVEAFLEAGLPAVVRRLENLVELDKLVNDGSPRLMLNRPTKSHFEIHFGFSRIVLAHLAGNPDFEQMVADTDAETWGGPNPDNDVNVLARHLRASGQRGG